MTDRMRCCVDHIKTSVDVDDWAKEEAERVFKAYDKALNELYDLRDRYPNSCFEDAFSEAIYVVKKHIEKDW